MYDLLNAIGFVIVYGTLSIIALIIYRWIKRKKWNKWLKLLALVPFIAYWIWSYESRDAFYYYAFEEVTTTEVPEKFEIIERYLSDFDDFGDYTAFAVFKLEPTDAKSISEKFRVNPSVNLIFNDPPELVSNYLTKNKQLAIGQDYKYSDKKGLELYGAVLSDHKTVVIYRASW